MTMTSETQFLPLSLPVIDFSIPNLKPETPELDSMRARVRKALEDYGCFEALFDGASMELRKALFEASKEAFDLLMQSKLSSSSSKFFKGYLTQIPFTPFPESIGFNSVDNLEVVDELTRKLWPQGNITFSKNIQAFGEKLIDLNLKVWTIIMESFGLEKYVEEHLNSANNHFHLLKYKGLDGDAEEKIGIDSHIDRHFLTILFQNDVLDGLEIKAKDGEEWIKAKPSQDSSFLVIAGASLHVLLNGRVSPPVHRVFITENKDRYSAGLFLRPKEGLIINVPEEVVDDEHPRLYKPFDYQAYLKVTDLDTKKTDRLSMLKTFCAL